MNKHVLGNQYKKYHYNLPSNNKRYKIMQSTLLLLLLFLLVPSLHTETPKISHIKTSQYELSLSLDHPAHKLTISLTDYLHSATYSKMYTISDIGKEVHRKMEIEDVFEVLAVHGGEEEIVYQGEGEQGSILVSKEGILLYKIQDGGKIVVYYNIYDRTSNKQLTYQSILQLTFLNSIKTSTPSPTPTPDATLKTRLSSTIKQKHQLSQKYHKLLYKFTLLQSSAGANHNYNGYFSYNQYNLSYISGQRIWTQFIFNDVIPYEQPYYYTLRIHTMNTNRHIRLGVVDYHRQKGARNSYTTNNALSYDATGGRSPDCGPVGKGFGQGDRVLVEVDRRVKVIRWYVNGSRQAEYTHQILGDRDRVFMPYVEMASHGDLVEVRFGGGVGEQEEKKETSQEL